MKELKLLMLAFALAGLAGCASTESAGGDETDEDDGQARASDGAGYTSGSTFVRPGDPISQHQQTLGGGFTP